MTHPSDTPTGDEREALATVLHEGQPNGVGMDGYGLDKHDARALADVALAAGFRRSGVPELRFPYASDWEQPETIIERVLDDAGYDLFHPWRAGVVNAIAAWVNEAGRAVEPQGEPSDAQVQAAWEALNEIHDTGSEAMRAALRAAWDVR